MCEKTPPLVLVDLALDTVQTDGWALISSGVYQLWIADHHELCVPPASFACHQGTCTPRLCTLRLAGTAVGRNESQLGESTRLDQAILRVALFSWWASCRGSAWD